MTSIDLTLISTVVAAAAVPAMWIMWYDTRRQAKAAETANRRAHDAEIRALRAQVKRTAAEVFFGFDDVVTLLALLAFQVRIGEASFGPGHTRTEVRRRNQLQTEAFSYRERAEPFVSGTVDLSASSVADLERWTTEFDVMRVAMQSIVSRLRAELDSQAPSQR